MSEFIDDNILDPNEYEHVFFDDGHIYVYGSDSDEEYIKEFSIEDWISKNTDELRAMYDDLKYFYFCEYASFSDFCEYVYYGEHTQVSDIDLWKQEAHNITCSFSGARKSSLRMFAAHNLLKILDMYSYYQNNYSFCMGPVEDFITMVYDYSTHRLE